MSPAYKITRNFTEKNARDNILASGSAQVSCEMRETWHVWCCEEQLHTYDWFGSGLSSDQ